ncbi:TerB family tellurite resistance protein [Aureimonas populi]|uniref:TerB family tellurite resistance protein n=1 Tax=Aureimonas populi TaxID=1701758 RepID=A0ABW5CH47_9HYPH|nr:TerB family tellurite resistance protein [Aureimonas populi]
MLEQIRQFLETLTGGGERDAHAADDPRVAAAALLAHVSRADGMVSPEERERLDALLAFKFDLGPAEAGEIAAAGRREDHQAVDLFRFTSVLMAHLDEAQRIAFVDLLWEMCFADGALHELEDNLVWRISELLAVPSRERMLAKRAAARRQADR